jgi:membrane protease YdiL (CAAX protease family)
VSSSDQLVPEIQIEPPPEPGRTAADPIHPGAENPPWSGLDLVIIGMVLLLALFFFSAAFFLLAMPQAGRGARAELSSNPRPQVIVPAMTLSYAAMLGAMYLLVTRRRRRPFWQAVAWHWPMRWWPSYLLSGGLLAVGLGQLSHFLPIPKSLPMDRFFQNREGAYLMTVFGVAVAPLAEELLFRGFLYPVLDRWLETLFMTPPELRRLGLGILVLAGWGYLVHRLPLPWMFLACMAVILGCGAVYWRRSLGGRTQLALLPGAALLSWTLASRSISGHAFGYMTGGLLGIAGLLVMVSVAPPLKAASAGSWGRLLAVLVTSCGFALVHSEQLGRAWGPLLVLFLVGLVLTVTRVVTRSLAPGFLMHVGYNLTLFVGLYLGTDHFRHLERLTQ